MQPEDKNIIFEMKNLDRLLRRNIEAAFRVLDGDDQLTRMHHWIIGFLYENQHRDIFQRDVEAEFKISRSTTSSMLTLMEKKGLITRQSVPGDARLKKLMLTEKAAELHLRHMDTIREFDERVNNSITPEEKRELLRILEKLHNTVRLSADSTHENKPEVDA